MKKSKKVKIAIIEDDKLLSKMLSERLGEEGFEVIYAHDGKQGLEMVLDEHPDLILLDAIMPIMDGIEMAQKLRQDEWGKNVPVIYLSNFVRLDVLMKTDPEMTGVEDLIIKGDLTVEEMVEKIKEKLKIE